MSDVQRKVLIRGARVHNLKDVDLEIPHGQLLAICGVSGSGKSSLAFDTLFAEGQRRYIESLSPATRQYLDQMEKPEADRIEGMPPSIAVQAMRGRPSTRSTVGTATQIVDYLRLLFARRGELHCVKCDQPVRSHDVDSIVEWIGAQTSGQRFQVVFEVHSDTDDPAERLCLARALRGRGLTRGIWQERSVDWTQDEVLQAWAQQNGPLHIVVDRLKSGTVSDTRLRDSVETALQLGRGRCEILWSPSPVEDSENADRLVVDGQPWRLFRFSQQHVCGNCGAGYPEPTPNLFHFNHPAGACPQCEGYGRIQKYDIERIVPDPGLSIREGAIAPWNTPAYRHELDELVALADDFDIPLDVPFRDLSESQVKRIWEGVPEREFGGLNGFFRWLERRRYKMHLRIFANRWRSYETCPACSGKRLRPESLGYRIHGRNFDEVFRLSVGQAVEFFDSLFESLSQQPDDRSMQRPLAEIRSRLRYLEKVGLKYLTLDRPLRTLSQGEAQRTQLTVSLGSQLVGMLYVLDEPTKGLHPAEVPLLADAVRSLQRRGNTVVVVDHHPELIRSVDRVIEVGPGAGDDGGQIVFDGTVDQMLADASSLTGQYMSGSRGVMSDEHVRRSPRGHVRLAGASGNNLQNLTVDFPLGVLCVVAGVSGAGKSSLVDGTLYPAVASHLGETVEPPLPFDSLTGVGALHSVVHVDDSPIGRSGRSNPVTYVKAYDEIRRLYADTLEARTRNFGPGHFSFNVDGGRCEKCQGEGTLTIDMQFMPDMTMVCDQCRGTRFRDEILKARYRGKSIHDVLQMTVRHAFGFFRGQSKLQGKLKTLIDVGLEYVRLGQPVNTLSTGESQRLKLAGYLNSPSNKRTMFLMNEPTSGLHMRDVVRLVDCFDSLIAAGHSIIVVEHNLELIKYADWIIEMGPGSAEDGGKVVACGTPEQLVENGASRLGPSLRPYLPQGNGMNQGANDGASELRAGG